MLAAHLCRLYCKVFKWWTHARAAFCSRLACSAVSNAMLARPSATRKSLKEAEICHSWTHKFLGWLAVPGQACRLQGRMGRRAPE